jgi:hypothetical protein
MARGGRDKGMLGIMREGYSKGLSIIAREIVL